MGSLGRNGLLDVWKLPEDQTPKWELLAVYSRKVIPWLLGCAARGLRGGRWGQAEQAGRGLHRM